MRIDYNRNIRQKVVLLYLACRKYLHEKKLRVLAAIRKKEPLQGCVSHPQILERFLWKRK